MCTRSAVFVIDLSQLGELCHLVDEAFVLAHPEIHWREMYGLRDRILHDHDGVDFRLVWEIISEDFPKLQIILQNLTDM